MNRNESTFLEGCDEMDRLYEFEKLPENVRQVGEPEEKGRIYFEDYVVTYMERFFGRAAEKVILVYLGKEGRGGCADCYFIYGAVELEFDFMDTEEFFSAEKWNELLEWKKEYFPESNILGWGIGIRMETRALKNRIKEFHKKHFSKPYQICYICNQGEETKQVYSFDGLALKKKRGYMVYYGKNPQMQNFMLRGKVKESAEAFYSDEVMANVRAVIKKNEEKRQGKKTMTAAAVLFVMVFLAGGFLLLQSNQKMERLEETIAAVSDTEKMADGDFEKDENASEKKESASEKKENTLGKKENSSGKKENSSGKKENASGKKESASGKKENSSEKKENSSEKKENALGKKENSSDKKENALDKKEEMRQEGIKTEDAKGKKEEEREKAEKNGTGNQKAEETKETGTKSTKETDQGETTGEKEKKKTTEKKEAGEKKIQEKKKNTIHNTGKKTKERREREKSEQTALGQNSYIVQKGDTLSQIVWREYRDLSKLPLIKERNRIEDENQIREGQRIILPIYSSGFGRKNLQNTAR